MTKAELIQWIEENISEHANIPCAWRHLANNIETINKPPKPFEIIVSTEQTAEKTDAIINNDFFARLQAMRG